MFSAFDLPSYYAQNYAGMIGSTYCMYAAS